MKGSTFLDFFPKLRQHAPQDDTLEASTFPASIGGGACHRPPVLSLLTNGLLTLEATPNNVIHVRLPARGRKLCKPPCDLHTKT